MGFYKKEEGQILNGEELVSTPNVTLSIDNKDEFTYPQDGWYWFDTFDEALTYFASTNFGTILTPRQARWVLLDEGLLDAVEEIVKLNRKYDIYWEYATEIRREDPILLQLAAALGITDEKLDEMFIKGAKL